LHCESLKIFQLQIFIVIKANKFLIYDMIVLIYVGKKFFSPPPI
jgi:hypothetical protein